MRPAHVVVARRRVEEEDTDASVGRDCQLHEHRRSDVPYQLKQFEKIGTAFVAILSQILKRAQLVG